MYTLTVTTEPVEEPVTLDEAKDALHVLNTDEDGRISNLIKSAREFAESYCGIKIMTQTVQLSMDRFPDTEFGLGTWPLQSIVSVKYDDTSSPSTEQTLTVNTDYYADTTVIEGRVRTIGGWPSVAVKPNAVRISMTAGYASADVVPERIKEGIKAYIIYLYDLDMDMEKAAKAILWPERII